jgi:hypothetical protein
VAAAVELQTAAANIDHSARRRVCGFNAPSGDVFIARSDQNEQDDQAA